MRHLLQGAIDMHIHSGPAVIKRLHSMEVAKELHGAGYAGFVIKDHHLPTPALARLVTESHPAGDFIAYGGIVLNSAVGGINLQAVDASCAMGGRMVILPTISSPRHLATLGDLFAGNNTQTVEERAVPITENGVPTPEVEAVLEYIAAHPGVILVTGHSAADDLDVVIRRAVELGVERILVNHPVHTIGAAWEQMEAWSRLEGVYLEVTAVDMEGMSNTARFPMTLMEEYFKRIPVEKTVVTSDFGQVANGSPVAGMERFIGALLGFGVSEDDIVMMVRDIPARLLA